MWREENSLYLLLTVDVSVDCNYNLVFKVSIYQGDVINISVQENEGIRGS